MNKFEGECIAIIKRLNDVDDKLVVVPDNVCYTADEIKQMTDFQEKHFGIEIEIVIDRREHIATLMVYK